jgi:RNA polymerase sigma factor (sigma-70 family)
MRGHSSNKVKAHSGGTAMTRTSKIVSLQDGLRRRRSGDNGSVPGNEKPSETLGQAFVRSYDTTKAFLRKRTGDPQIAEELTQEIWLVIAERAEDPTIVDPEAWLRRVTVNLSTDWLRQNRFRSQFVEAMPDLPDVEDNTPDQHRIVDGRQRMSCMDRILDEMPPRRRAAFLLYRGRGLTAQQTADELGISVMTARTQIRDALTFLRQRMIDAGLWP